MRGTKGSAWRCSAIAGGGARQPEPGQGAATVVADKDSIPGARAGNAGAPDRAARDSAGEASTDRRVGAAAVDPTNLFGWHRGCGLSGDPSPDLAGPGGRGKLAARRSRGVEAPVGRGLPRSGPRAGSHRGGDRLGQAGRAFPVVAGGIFPFHGMVVKAKAGELNLARTIWGWVPGRRNPGKAASRAGQTDRGAAKPPGRLLFLVPGYVSRLGRHVSRVGALGRVPRQFAGVGPRFGACLEPPSSSTAERSLSPPAITARQSETELVTKKTLASVNQ